MSKEALISEDEHLDQHALLRQMRSVSKTISINGWLVFVLNCAALVILGVTLVLSKSLSNEKKIFLGTIVCVLVVSIQIVLCIARREANVLVIFSTFGAFASGICLGFATWYI
jgi:hypothetical protein